MKLIRKENDPRSISCVEMTEETYSLFPSITADRQKLQIGTSITSAQIRSFLDRCVAGLKREGIDLLGQGGQFTTHCFRRGGAQHRFFESNKRWTLAAIKYWGGWREKDGPDTIGNYVLNELEHR